MYLNTTSDDDDDAPTNTCTSTSSSSTITSGDASVCTDVYVYHLPSACTSQPAVLSTLLKTHQDQVLEKAECLSTHTGLSTDASTVPTKITATPLSEYTLDIHKAHYKPIEHIQVKQLRYIDYSPSAWGHHTAISLQATDVSS